MKFVLFVIFTTICIKNVRSQFKLNLKLGNDRMIYFQKTPKTRIFEINTFYAYNPIYGIELQKVSKRQKGQITFGLGVNTAVASFAINASNEKIQFSSSSGRYFQIFNGIGKVYVGKEKQFKYKKEKVGKNKFSYQYGFNLFVNGESTSRKIELNDIIVMKDGTTGAAKYYYSKNSGFFLIPSLYSGLKYKINNKQNKEVLDLEFQMNAMPFSNMNHIAEYTLNGSPYLDVRKNAGLQFQFCLVKKLYTEHKAIK